MIAASATTTLIIIRQCLWCYLNCKVIARVHPVHLMNVEHRQAVADPQSKLTDLDCKAVIVHPIIATPFNTGLLSPNVLLIVLSHEG